MTRYGSLCRKPSFCELHLSFKTDKVKSPRLVTLEFHGSTQQTFQGLDQSPVYPRGAFIVSSREGVQRGHLISLPGCDVRPSRSCSHKQLLVTVGLPVLVLAWITSSISSALFFLIFHFLIIPTCLTCLLIILLLSYEFCSQD